VSRYVHGDSTCPKDKDEIAGLDFNRAIESIVCGQGSTASFELNYFTNIWVKKNSSREGRGFFIGKVFRYSHERLRIQ